MTFDIDCDAHAQVDAKARRERIAVKCLQGMWANTDFSAVSFAKMADDAVKAADALIAELDKQDEPVKVSGSKLCVGCNTVLPMGEFDEASPEYPTRDGRVYKCRECVKEVPASDNG